MSGWALATWAAIFVLSFGAIAVFIWFLGDAVRLLRARIAQRDSRQETVDRKQ